MEAAEGFVSPFFEPEALAIAAKRFTLIEPGDISRDSGPFPWVESRRYLFKTLALLGDPYADYRSVLRPESSLDSILALRADRFPGHIIELANISELDPTCPAIEEWITRHGLTFRKIPLSRAPFLAIAGSWSDYKAAKRGKYWHNLSRAKRLLESSSGPTRFRILSQPELIAGSLGPCLSLYRKNWNRLTSASFFISSEGERFLIELLNAFSLKGKAELALLEQGRELLGFSVGLMSGSTYYFYLFATNKDARLEKYSVGKLLVSQLLESVFDRGFTVFDFMAGEEPYKYEWTSSSRGRFTYYIAPGGATGRLRLSMFLAAGSIYSALKQNRTLRRLLAGISLLFVRGRSGVVPPQPAA